jgi:hypothetical protein
MRFFLGSPALFLIACGGDADSDDLVLDDPIQLPAPDLSGVDLPASFIDAFQLMATVDLRAVWAGHVSSFQHRQGGCPDLFAGNPDVENIDLDMDAPGTSWSDFCEQGDGTTWSGFQYWEVDIAAEGDATTAEGRTTEAERLLFGDGVVGQGDAVLFEFDGEATDALTLVEAADGYRAWTYTSLVVGTATGDLAFDPVGSPTPGGLRTDLYRRATGGNDATLEARGNVYLFEHRLQGRFDSIGLDLELRGEAGAGPEDCTKEPRGWIALRDEDAYWYDLVFEPRFSGDPDDPDYPNDPYSACDGCGTLYVRGLEQEGVEVCLDLSFLWDSALTSPDPTDFAFTLRKPGEER